MGGGPAPVVVALVAVTLAELAAARRAALWGEPLTKEVRRRTCCRCTRGVR